MMHAIATHLWQSTLFAGAAAVLTLAFRANQARVRYWIWLAASLKFLIPFALLTTLGSQIHITAPSAIRQITAAPPVLPYTADDFSPSSLPQPRTGRARPPLSADLFISLVWGIPASSASPSSACARGAASAA